MKHIKSIHEAFSNGSQEESDYTPRSLKESDLEFKCIFAGEHYALLSRKNNPKELYLLQLEDPHLERFLERFYLIEDPLDPDDPYKILALETFLTDVWNNYSANPDNTKDLGRIPVMTRKDIGEGLPHYYPVLSILDDNPHMETETSPVVKVDEDLAKTLMTDFENIAYNLPVIPTFRNRGKSKGDKNYLKGMKALLRAFPGIE